MWSWKGTKFIVTAFHSFSGNFMFWSPFARYSPLLSSKGASWCFFSNSEQMWCDLGTRESLLWSFRIILVEKIIFGPLLHDFRFFSAKTRNDSTPNYGQDVFLVPKINTNNRITLFSQNNASSFLRTHLGDCCFALDFGEFPRNGGRSYGSISCESSPGISWNLKGFGNKRNTIFAEWIYCMIVLWIYFWNLLHIWSVFTEFPNFPRNHPFG